jgi:hypothetical protein
MQTMRPIPKATLHARILASANNEVENYSPLDKVPFNVHLTTLGNLSFYAFTLTSPPGGRPTGEYKIQLIVPEQKRGERGHLYQADGAFTILAGWSRDENIFSLWDAYAHETFAYSQNLQVKGNCVWLAQTNGISTCKRQLRGGRGVETVVVCRADRFIEGIRARIHFSAHRLSPESNPL